MPAESCGPSSWRSLLLEEEKENEAKGIALAILKVDWEKSCEKHLPTGVSEVLIPAFFRSICLLTLRSLLVRWARMFLRSLRAGGHVLYRVMFIGVHSNSSSHRQRYSPRTSSFSRASYLFTTSTSWIVSRSWEQPRENCERVLGWEKQE